MQIVSPEQVLYEGEGEMVVCRTTDGELAFLPGHAPFLGALGTGTVRVVLPQGEQVAAVHEGFVEVSDDRVVVLSDVAELPEQIDVARRRPPRRRRKRRSVPTPRTRLLAPTWLVPSCDSTSPEQPHRPDGAALPDS